MSMDTVFGNSGVGNAQFSSFKADKVGGYNPYDPTDPGSYEAFVDMMIADSRDYEQSILAGDRNQATAYYYGFLPNLDGTDNWQYSDQTVLQEAGTTYEDIVGEDARRPNRSRYVSTDVRDAILQMLPSLVRIFGASENVISLVPRTQNDVATAEQATDYVNYVFWNDNPGFLTLYGAFKDAMTVKTGFVKWWTDDVHEKKTKTFQNITREQIQLILSEQDANTQIVGYGQTRPDGTIDHITFQYEVAKPTIKVMGVPPEEMRLDRNARTFATSRIVGHERVVPIDELVSMGYQREQCIDYIQSSDTHNFTMEAQMRNPGRATNTRVDDGVNYGEWYIKVDKDGDGQAELRYICTMGEDHKIVHDEPANRIKFAVFSCDPISHTIVGDSVGNLVMDIQRLKTNMMRGVLDSLAESINPKTVINELMVNVDDAMNDDLGAIIRTRGDPNNTVSYTVTPFAGQAAVPIIALINENLQRRTGLSDAAKGLDPKALQSSTMIGVDAIIQGAQERIELIARVLAETGFKDLFTGLYNEVCENPSQQRTLRIRGNWQAYDTSTFDASMGVEVNPTLGKGSDTVRMAALQQIKVDQTAIFQQFGPGNPVVGIPEMLNTITDMLNIVNIKNVNRYFKMPPPQVLQALSQSPKEPDPMTLSAHAQMEKVKSDSAQAVGAQHLQAEKQAQDLALKNKIADDKNKFQYDKLTMETEKARLQHEAQLAKIAMEQEVGMAKASKPTGGNE